MGVPWRECAEGMSIDVWVMPRASRVKVGGLHGGRLKVAVTSPPVEGAANEAVCTAVASALGVAKSQVAVRHGHTGRQKTLVVCGDAGILCRKISALVGTDDATS